MREYRRSRLLPGVDGIGVDFETRLREIVPEVFAHFGMAMPAELGFEKQLTAHNDGEYFRMHNDNGSPSTASRLLTYVYYFHGEPAAFSGGQIRIYDSLPESGSWEPADKFVDIAPDNNMLLLFPSGQMHEVRRISCPSEAFGDGRFTVNGWFRDPQVPTSPS